jgi:hypothetical protein
VPPGKVVQFSVIAVAEVADFLKALHVIVLDLEIQRLGVRMNRIFATQSMQAATGRALCACND